MDNRGHRGERQQGLADFGEFALASDDLDEVLTQACRLVTNVLGTHRAVVLEIQDGETELLVRAGLGWKPEIVGRQRFAVDETSSERVAIQTGRPVTTRDIRDENRFTFAGFLTDEGVRAVANVPIFMSGRRAYGILQVDANEPRDFSDADIDVLRTYATIIGPVVDRLHKIQRLRDVEERERRRDVRFRAVFDTAPVGLSVISAEGHFLRVNRELCHILGRTPDELVGMSVAEVTHEPDVLPSVSALRQSLATGEATSLDKHYRRPNGELIPANSILTPLLASDGPSTIIAVTVDLSARRRAESALRKSEERFRALVTAGTYSIYRMSPDWQLIYQLDNDTLSGDAGPVESWIDRYILDEDRPRVVGGIEEAIRTKSLFDLEHRVRFADGRIGWVLSRAVPLIGPDGEIAEWFGAASDITERRVAAEALRAAEEKHRIELERRVEDATAELKAGRDLLRATMDSSTDMIQVFKAVRNDAGEIVDFDWILNNHASECQLGEMRGKSLLEHNPGVVAEGIFDAFKRVTETGVPEQAEHHYVHEQFDGWYYQSVVKLNDGVATTTKEISDWKRDQTEVLRLREEAAAARLRESEERFRSFAENSTDVLWIVDAGTRQLTYLSPAFERIWGEGRDAVLRDLARWRELMHPDDREQALTTLWRVLEGENIQITYRIRREDDGRVRWIQDSGFPIRNVGGQITHVGGITQDVTEQKEMGERLRENQRRLWTVIQGIPQLVWRAVDGGEWTWASPQWSSFTGQTLEESRGHGWLKALHPDDRDGALAGWREANGSSALAMETRLFHAGEGRHRWFQNRALPVRDEDGHITEWLGTSTDIDDLRQLQERQNVLVAELQHRTRNLLGVIRSMADRTADGASSLEMFLPTFRERLGALSRINGLLSKLESGDRVTFDQLIRTELGARGFPDDGRSERVMLDGPAGVRLRSATIQTFALAIHELATNAVKYGALSTDQGQLRVVWRLHKDEALLDRLQVEWIESGVSDMPEEGAPPQGGGYGRMLIEKALPYQLQAETSYELGRNGVRCTIDLPLR